MFNLFGILIGVRKFLIMLMFFAVMVIFRIYGLISGDEFAGNLQVAVVAFLGTNFGEHALESLDQFFKRKEQEKKEK